MMYSARFVFIHIPRTGGTALTSTFGHHPGVSKDVHSLKHASASVLKAIIEPGIWESAYRFTVYRSNEDIARSWYRHVVSTAAIYERSAAPFASSSWVDFVRENGKLSPEEFTEQCYVPKMEDYLDCDETHVISWEQAHNKLLELCSYPSPA